MLGENHSLTAEFPEFNELIASLMTDDSVFASDTKKYNSLDTEIRKLELRGTPIMDEVMMHMKQERVELKDSLYQRLRQAAH